MPERELHLKKGPELTDKQASVLADRLALAFLGRQRFTEAVTILGDPQVYAHNEEAVQVANGLASVGMTVDPVLDVLNLKAQQEVDISTQRYLAAEIAKVSALAGDYSTYSMYAPLTYRPTEVHCFAAELQISRKQDPAVFLQKVETLTLEETNNDPGNFGVRQVIDYSNIGKLYAKAGKIDEARRAFSIAEGIIAIARTSQKPALPMIGGGEKVSPKPRVATKASIIGYATYYNGLVKSYAELGWWQDASRIAKYLEEDESPYFSFAIEKVTKKQIEAGLILEAVETARLLGGPLYFKAFAHKAIFEARRGNLTSYQEIANGLEQIIEGGLFDERYVDYLFRQAKIAAPGGNIYAVIHYLSLATEPLSNDDYVKIRSLLGEAASLTGDVDTAKTHFQKALIALDKEEPIFQPYMLLDIAKSLDNAGFEVLPIFQEIFAVAQTLVSKDAGEWEQEISQEAEIKWGAWAETIEELSRRGYLKLAQEAMQGYISKLYPGSRARLLAYLGAIEAKQGLSPKEISNLSLDDVHKIMESGNEIAKQALLKLGLVA